MVWSLTVREAAFRELQREDPAALKSFLEKIREAQSRDDLTRAWRSIPEFRDRPDTLEVNVFAPFPELSGPHIAAGVRAGVSEILQERERLPPPYR